jgi:prophage maintenance system killer protein
MRATAQMNKTQDIVIYRTDDGTARIEVNLRDETVWITQKQMAELFTTERSVVTKHINNILKTKELRQKSVCANFAHTAADGKTYQTQFYNLDMIISVGYRVNSKRGTQFRIWATNVLKQHLIEGYTLNEKRLRAQQEKYRELLNAVQLIGQIADRRELSSGQAEELIRVIRDYAYGLDLIDGYDHQRLEVSGVSRQMARPISHDQARRAIEQLRAQYHASDLFGREKDKSFQGSLVSIFQTFGKRQLYPSIEEKAAHLLYFLVKNHPFVDGNKRIAAFLFLWFLGKNRALYRKDGSKRIADNALVAITLMVAESRPADKDLIVKVIVNLINQKN